MSGHACSSPHAASGGTRRHRRNTEYMIKQLKDIQRSHRASVKRHRENKEETKGKWKRLKATFGVVHEETNQSSSSNVAMVAIPENDTSPLGDKLQKGPIDHSPGALWKHAVEVAEEEGAAKAKEKLSEVALRITDQDSLETWAGTNKAMAAQLALILKLARQQPSGLKTDEEVLNQNMQLSYRQERDFLYKRILDQVKKEDLKRVHQERRASLAAHRNAKHQTPNKTLFPKEQYSSGATQIMASATAQQSAAFRYTPQTLSIGEIAVAMKTPATPSTENSSPDRSEVGAAASWRSKERFKMAVAKEKIILMNKVVGKINYEGRDNISTNTLLAFLSMLFCCFCIGFMALGSSVRAKECKIRKQYFGARLHANRAKRWAVAAIMAGLCIYGVVGCIYFIYEVSGRFTENYKGYDEIAGRKVIMKERPPEDLLTNTQDEGIHHEKVKADPVENESGSTMRRGGGGGRG